MGSWAQAIVAGLLAAMTGCPDEPAPGAATAEAPSAPAAETSPAVPLPAAGKGAVEVLAPGDGAAVSWPSGEGAKRTLVTTVNLPAPGDGPAEEAAPAIPVRLVLAAERSDAGAWVFSVRTVEALAPVEAGARRRVQRRLDRVASLAGRYDPSARAVTFFEAPAGEALAPVRTAVERVMPLSDPPLPDGGLRIGTRYRTALHDQEASFEVVHGDGGRPAVRVVIRGAVGSPLAALVAPQAPHGTASDRLAYDGDPVAGAVLFARTLPGAVVHVGRRKMPVSEDGRFLVGLGRTPRIPTLVRVVYPDRTMLVHALAPRRRTFEDERIDGLPPDVVDPPRSVRKRLAEIRKVIDAVRRKGSPVPRFERPFIWPTKGRVTSTYGRKRILNGEEKGIHWGVDIGAPVGRSVVAPADGTVVFVHRNVPLAGKVVIVDHGLGLTSSFLHLSRIHVREGQVVSRGERIGRVGRTGRATGPHLDWRMNVLDVRVDPMLLVEGTPDER